MLNRLSNAHYVPTLCMRPAEMRAIQELPESDKDKLLPFLNFSPWVGSYQLQSGLDRFKKSFGERPTVFNLDPFYKPTDGNRDAVRDFQEMLAVDNGGKAYFDFVEPIENFIPTIQIHGNEKEFRKQVDRAEEIGRGTVFTINQHNDPIDPKMLDIIAESGHRNFGFHVDYGWRKNPVSFSDWYQGNCKEIFDRFEEIPIVISVSSFPKSFSEIEGVVSLTIGAKSLFEDVRSKFNNQKIIYGDWASTRPRSDSGGGTPRPRIDYCDQENWIISKELDDDFDYQEAAVALHDSSKWIDGVNVWGTYMIEKTADGDPYGISNASGVTAVRINLHLHMQANQGVPIESVDTDDPWED